MVFKLFLVFCVSIIVLGIMAMTTDETLPIQIDAAAATAATTSLVLIILIVIWRGSKKTIDWFWRHGTHRRIYPPDPMAKWANRPHYREPEHLLDRR